MMKLRDEGKNTRPLLILGLVGNLALLGYFKYVNFFIDNVNAVSGSNIDWPQIVLPIGISFITFQKIAYLIDVSRGEKINHDLVHFALFVSFFPQLVAGPILHHREIMPQFERWEGRSNLFYSNVAIGLTIFTLGLFKKVCLADNLALFAGPVFNSADAGSPIAMAEAWGAALAYTLQLYFDFSGYSDMAVGLGRLFGVQLPINFNSPYKAGSIIEFWQRWHMTLSRFLRDYLYVPLGGNRRGTVMRYRNVMITMLLGGLWHGAGWNFLIWGGIHGLLISLNHLWRSIVRDRASYEPFGSGYAVIAHALTFAAIVVTWVPFRATTLQGTKTMLGSMAGLRGADALLIISQEKWLAAGAPLLLGLTVAVWLLPNTWQIMRIGNEKVTMPPGWTLAGILLQWRPNVAWALAVGMIMAYSVLQLGSSSEFLYFDF
jgi:D-alanyl-lipoteichoic acid acyltransferase DltB (MBOAT superfamily)